MRSEEYIAKYREVIEKLNSNVSGKAEKVNLAPLIDHTLLKHDIINKEIVEFCQEAIKFKFAAVIVNSSYIPIAVRELKSSGVKVCSPISFPLGATYTCVKVAEAKKSLEVGAQELDMVINIGALKSGDMDTVRNDIRSIVEIAKGKALVKVILETCLLSNEEKISVCKIAKEEGADYVKTSTGFSKAGATVEDIKLMRKIVGQDMGVKAAGGIRSYQSAVELLKAGADRLGTSSSLEIVS